MARKSMGFVEVENERCKGCGLCVDACNMRLMDMSRDVLNSNGYHPAVFSDLEQKCSGCALCAVICPDVALAVYKYNEEEKIS